MSPLLVALLLAQWQPPGITVRDEGTGLGQAGIVNCTGTGVTCTLGLGGVWTLDSTAGGGTYSGIGPCGDSAWVTALNDNAAPTCSSIYFSDLVGTAALTQIEDSATASLCLLSGGTGGDPAWGSCGPTTLSGLGNPTGDKEFVYPTGTKQLFTFTGAPDFAFSLHGDGSFTGAGDLAHFHLQGTGLSAGADVLSLEATDADATGLRITMGSSTHQAATITGAVGVTGAVTASSFSGPLTGAVTGNASTATTAGALTSDPSNCTGNNWATGIQASGAADCAQVGFGNLSGSAALSQITDSGTSGLCLLSGGGGGDPAWTTCPSGGGGAPTTAGYWTKTADAGLSNEQDMSALGTGLVVNTTTTGVPTIYAGTSCTNQFPRSLNASGAATCASVSMANDVTGTLGTGNGGTGQASNWTQGGVVYGSSTTVLASSAQGTAGQCLLSGGSGAPTWGACASGSGTTLQVTGSDVTNSTTSPVTIFSTTVSASTQYGFHCELVGQGTATSLPRYNVNGPSSTNIAFETRRFTTTSAQTLLVLQAFSGSAQTATCTSSCNATNLPIYIAGVFTVGGTGGTLSFQVTSSTSGQTVTVRRGSFCRIF